MLALAGAVWTKTGGLCAGGRMPLSIDYENQTVTDLISDTFYEIEVDLNAPE